MITYIPHRSIDFERWDKVIQSSPERVPYALSWYLNVVSPRWNALIQDDYRVVMPVPVKQKFGFFFIIQPPYCQQLGLFGDTTAVDAGTIDEFLHHTALNVPFLTLGFNAGNSLPATIPGLTHKRNYILHLDKSYNAIYKGYSENTCRNLRKAAREKIVVQRMYDFKPLFGLKWVYRPSGVRNKTLHVAYVLMQQALERGMGEVWGACDETGKLLAGCFFLKDDRRSVYLISASSPEGKSDRAMFLLIDRYIRENAGSERLLDFEGSMIPGIARFFKGFGAEATVYPVLSMNRLPGIIQWFQRKI